MALLRGHSLTGCSNMDANDNNKKKNIWQQLQLNLEKNHANNETEKTYKKIIYYSL
jgi:uncharacterized OsmC-like protein